MAFVRWSGIRPLLEPLRRHCRDGKSLRIVTTTYTNSTELRALDELASLGAKIKVSYDTASTRLHAKAWLFHRDSGYSTAYIGSSNLTHSRNGHRARVERSRLRRAQPRRRREDDCRLRVLLGERRLRPVRPRRVPASGRAVTEPEHSTAAESSRDRPAPVPGATARADRAGARPRATPQPARLGDRHRQDRHGGGRLRAPSGTVAARPAAVRRAPRGDPRTEPRDLPHALRDASFGELWVGGKRPITIRPRLRVDPEPQPLRARVDRSRRTSMS